MPTQSKEHTPLPADGEKSDPLTVGAESGELKWFAHENDEPSVERRKNADGSHTRPPITQTVNLQPPPPPPEQPSWYKNLPTSSKVFMQLGFAGLAGIMLTSFAAVIIFAFRSAMSNEQRSSANQAELNARLIEKIGSKDDSAAAVLREELGRFREDGVKRDQEAVRRDQQRQEWSTKHTEASLAPLAEATREMKKQSASQEDATRALRESTEEMTKALRQLPKQKPNPDDGPEEHP